MSILLAIIILFIYVNYFIPLPGWLGYWDELISIACIFLGIINIRKHPKTNKNSDCFRIVLYTIMVCFIGLVGNVLFELQPSINAIFRDMIGFAKFPIVFVVIKNNFKYRYIDRTVRRYVLPVLKYLIWIIAIFGGISIFVDVGLSHMTDIRGGIRPYKFLADHPTSLVISLVLIWCTLIAFENEENRKRFIILYFLISFSLILTMRTKAFVIVAAIWYIKYLSNFTRKFKIIYWISIAAVFFAASYSKLQLYSTFGGSGRFDLYTGSITLSKMYFPIGAGFGTYASHLSGAYVSKVYNFIKVSEIFDLSGHSTTIIGDTGYPYYLGQFGFLGIVLIILIFVHLFKICSYKRHKNYSCFFVLLYIIVGLTTESTLLNFGVEIAVILAINLSIIENKQLQYSESDHSKIKKG